MTALGRLRRLVLVLFLIAAAGQATEASGDQTSKLGVTLTPERLGASTTIHFDFQIHGEHSRVPPPLTGIELLYPINLGLITSGLGIATCSPTTLETFGPQGCPADSLMGRGNALVDIPIGPETISEPGQITTWMGPVEEGHLALLFYAEGKSPVSAQLIFTSQILEAPPPYGGNLDTNVPIIPGLPEGPDATVVQMHATLGSQGITYYTHSRGKKIRYQPDGLRLPHVCPRGGFPFAASFTFADGSHSSAHAAVPCPPARARKPTHP